MSTLSRSEIHYFQKIRMSGSSTLSASSATFAINGSAFHLMTTFKPCKSGCSIVQLANGMLLHRLQSRSFYLPIHALPTNTDVTQFSRGPQDVQNADSQHSPAISDHPPSPKRTITSTPQRSSISPQTDVTHHRYPPSSAPPPGSPAPFHALTPSCQKMGATSSGQLLLQHRQKCEAIIPP